MIWNRAKEMLANCWASYGTGPREPARVFLLANRPINDVEIAAVGVYSNGSHVGILHRQVGGVRFLHLCGHDSLVNQVPNISATPGHAHLAIWIAPKLDPSIIRNIAGLCRHFVFQEQYGDFPYGFSHPRGFFREIGGVNPFVIRPHTVGLTCATFVLSIFDYACYPLIRYRTWAIRKGDKAARQRVIDNMRQMGKQHAERVIREVGPRYHPLEVAAATSSNNYPVSFGTALRLRQRLEVICRRWGSIAP